MTTLVTEVESRVIEAGGGDRQEAIELLQLLLLGELLAGSRELWIVARDIHDFPLLDNRSAAFATIEPLWERRWLMFSEVLERLSAAGTRVTAVLDTDGDNEELRRRLGGRLAGGSRLIVASDGIEEIVLTDQWFLSGRLAPRLLSPGTNLQLDRNPERRVAVHHGLATRYGAAHA